MTDMISVTDIQTYAAAHADEALELLCALAAIPAPSHHEEQRAVFCKTWLETHGVRRVSIDSVGNVRIPFGELDGPLAMITAHSDVVFPDTTPFLPTIRGGRVYCPGVGDDTANVVALMMTAVFLTAHGIVPQNGGLLLAVNVGEEGLGNLKGSRRLVADYEKHLTAFVSLDCHADELIDRAVGSKRCCVECHTVGGHSYFDFGAPNAIAQLAAVIGDLYALEVPSDTTTYNVGTVEGGTSVNTVAQHAHMLFEWRSDNASHLRLMEQRFESVIQRHRENGVLLTVTPIGERPCGSGVDEEKQCALADHAAIVIERYYGRSPIRKSGSTDCNIPLSVGIPSVCFGCVTGAGMHTREEYINIDSIAAGLCVAMDTALWLCR